MGEGFDEGSDDGKVVGTIDGRDEGSDDGETEVVGVDDGETEAVGVVYILIQSLGFVVKVSRQILNSKYSLSSGLDSVTKAFSCLPSSVHSSSKVAMHLFIKSSNSHSYSKVFWLILCTSLAYSIYSARFILTSSLPLYL